MFYSRYIVRSPKVFDMSFHKAILICSSSYVMSFVSSVPRLFPWTEFSESFMPGCGPSWRCSICTPATIVCFVLILSFIIASTIGIYVKLTVGLLKIISLKLLYCSLCLCRRKQLSLLIQSLQGSCIVENERINSSANNISRKESLEGSFSSENRRSSSHITSDFGHAGNRVHHRTRHFWIHFHQLHSGPLFRSPQPDALFSHSECYHCIQGPHSVQKGVC